VNQKTWVYYQRNLLCLHIHLYQDQDTALHFDGIEPLYLTIANRLVNGFK